MKYGGKTTVGIVLTTDKLDIGNITAVQSDRRGWQQRKEKEL